MYIISLGKEWENPYGIENQNVVQEAQVNKEVVEERGVDLEHSLKGINFIF